MATFPKVDSAGLRLAKITGAERVSSVAKVTTQGSHRIVPTPSEDARATAILIRNASLADAIEFLAIKLRHAREVGYGEGLARANQIINGDDHPHAQG